jgi:hypothetical protein
MPAAVKRGPKEQTEKQSELARQQHIQGSFRSLLSHPILLVFPRTVDEARCLM